MKLTAQWPPQSLRSCRTGHLYYAIIHKVLTCYMSSSEIRQTTRTGVGADLCKMVASMGIIMQLSHTLYVAGMYSKDGGSASPVHSGVAFEDICWQCIW